MRTPPTRLISVLILVLITTGFSASTMAGGFEYGPQGVHAAGRGGAFTVSADDPTAVFWNPSRLALIKGTRILLNVNSSYMNLNYKRADAYLRTPKFDSETGQYKLSNLKLTDGAPTVQTFDTVSNGAGWFPLGASMGITSDFGLKDWGFGLAMYGPSAYGKVAFPDGSNAANRYNFMNMDTLLMFVTASAAWKYKEWFGIGAGVSYVMMPWMKYSMAIIAPGNPGEQNGTLNTTQDMRADVDMSYWKGFTANVGAWVRPVKSFEIGLSSRVIPVDIEATGTMTMSGTENSLFNKIDPAQIKGKLSFTYPIDVRVGARYRHMDGEREVFDIEANFAWEQWSSLDAFRVQTLEKKELMGTVVYPISMTLERHWEDIYSVRLGGQYNAIPDWLTVRLGGWWESGAQPEEYTTIDLPSWDRFGIGAGLSTNLWGVEIGLSYMHVFQTDRDITGAGAVFDSETGTWSYVESEGKIYQQVLQADENVPMRNGYVVNDGTYSSSFDVITVGVEFNIDHLMRTAKGDFGPDPVVVGDDPTPASPEPMPEDNPTPETEPTSEYE